MNFGEFGGPKLPKTAKCPSLIFRYAAPYFFYILGDQHRVFLQGMLTRGMVNSKELDELHDISLARCGIPITENRLQKQNELKHFLKVIGENIGHLGICNFIRNYLECTFLTKLDHSYNPPPCPAALESSACPLDS